MKPSSSATFLLSLALAFAVPVGAAAQSEPAGDSPTFTPIDECFIDSSDVEAAGVAVDCGYVAVPAQHGADDGGTLQLGVVRHNATGDDPAAPIVFLAGGPGGSIMGMPAGLLAAPDAYGQLVASHDLIFLEQRGAGVSVPSLSCPEFDTAAVAARQANDAEDEVTELLAPAIAACRDRLVEESVGLDAYDNLENAADVASAIEALGYESAILYGQSYGTELIQHVMRDFPEIVEAAVLDGSAPLSNTAWEQNLATAYEAGLDEVIAACDEDSACADAYSDIAGVYEAQITALDQEPLTLAGQDLTQGSAEDAPAIEIELDGETTAELILAMIGDPTLRSYLPATIYGLQDGDTSAFSLFPSVLTSPLPFTLGMHLAIVCSDDPWTADTELEASKYTGATLVAERETQDFYRAGCEIFDVEPVSADVDTNVTTDVPVLLLNGRYDTAAPRFASMEIAEALPNATVVDFPEGGHVQVGPFRDPCGAAILAQFADDPTAELDTSCVDAMAPTQFLVP